MSGGAQRKVHVRLHCSSQSVFLRDVAPRLGGSFWVETDATAAPGEQVALTIELTGEPGSCRGTARVVSTDASRSCLQLLSLDEGGPQFVLGRQSAAPDDVLLPGRWHEGPHPFTEAPTPAFGTPVPKIVQPFVPPKVPASSSWSGGLQPFDTLRNYQLLERLGRGGMAEVYVARQLLDGGVEKLVALKLALPELGVGTPYGGLFLDEARVSTSLQHRGLIQVFDFGEALGRPYLAMEYVRGRDLSTLLERARRARPAGWPAFARTVALEVLHALEYLHSRLDPGGTPAGVLHRDVSLANVLVSEFGEVKLIDFGVASSLARDGAPRQAESGAPTGLRGDLSAVGRVLGELLAPQPSEVARRATGAEAERHYRSAREMIHALTAELGKDAAVDLGATVRGLCGEELDDERQRVDRATVQARRQRPTARGAVPRAIRAATRTPRGRAVSAAAAGVLLLAVAAAARVAGSARALDLELERIDERMSLGALAGSEESALAALAAARALAPSDPRVEARAHALARVFELMADTAAERGNEGEAVVHLEALAAADPGRPGLLGKLIAAHAKKPRLPRP